MTQTIRSTIAPSPVIRSEITRTGAVGPPGQDGVDGQPGPNLVTGDTDTDITGPLFGNGSKVRAATADEVISSTALQAALANLILAGPGITATFNAGLMQWTISVSSSAAIGTAAIGSTFIVG